MLRNSIVKSPLSRFVQVSITLFLSYLLIGNFYDFRLASGMLIASFFYYCASLFKLEKLIYNSATCFVIFIGISPLYLVLRGFITRSKLNVYDFPIYFFVFLLFFTVYFSLKSKASNSGQLNQLGMKFRLLSSSLTALFVLIVIQIYLLNKSIGNAVAWIASGDSKNHFVNAEDIIRFGFLDPATFLTQPVSSPSILAMLMAQGGNDLTVVNELMRNHLVVYAFFWVLLIGLLGLVVAATGETLGKLLENKKSQPNTFVLGTLSLVSMFSLFIGPSTWDGFFTAIFGISTVVLMTNWLLIQIESREFSWSQVSIGFLLFISSLMAWMFIIPLTGVIFLAGLVIQTSKTSTVARTLVFAWISFAVILGAVIQFSSIGQEFIYKAKVALSALGAVNVSNPDFYLALIIVAFCLGWLFKDSNKYLFYFFVCISTFHLLALLAFKQFSNLGFLSWNYYLLKYQWIMVSTLFILLTTLALINFYGALKLKIVSKNILAIAILGSSYLLSESIVPINQVWQKVESGWQNPRNYIIDSVLDQNIDQKNPTLFFQYGYAGDARLGNFWLTAFADPIEPLKGWNYTIDTTGNPQQLCDVNAYYPSVTVITSSNTLADELNELCPDEPFQIEFKPN